MRGPVYGPVSRTESVSISTCSRTAIISPPLRLWQHRVWQHLFATERDAAGVEGLCQVADDVARVLDACRKAEESRCDAHPLALPGGDFAVRGHRGAGD